MTLRAQKRKRGPARGPRLLRESRSQHREAWGAAPQL